MLRRQAIYLLGFDERAPTRRWLLDEQRDALRLAGRRADVPSWVAVWSSAVALAQDGDGDPLQGFVARGPADIDQEVANLNYWAYWVGETTDTYVDDRFMIDAAAHRWNGARVLEDLSPRVRTGSPYLPLNAHTLWALVLARPRVLEDNSGLRAATNIRVQQLLGSDDLPAATRSELTGVAYAVRLAQR